MHDSSPAPAESDRQREPAPLLTDPVAAPLGDPYNLSSWMQPVDTGLVATASRDQEGIEGNHSTMLTDDDAVRDLDIRTWNPNAEGASLAPLAQGVAETMHSDSQTSVDLAAGRDRDHAMQSASPAEPSARTSDDDTTATPDNDEIVAALSSVFDPEIPVDIYSLGLIYAVDIMQHDVHLTMTLTTPNCPVAGSLPQEVADTVVACPGVENVSVTLTFDPPWTIDSMSDDARLVLGY